MMASRKEYTKEFKQEAVRLAQESGNKSQVVRELGIHSSMLRRWEKQLAEYGEKAFPGKGHVQNEELSQLQRENQRLQETVEILKKAVGIFSSRPR
jgi:transposase